MSIQTQIDRLNAIKQRIRTNLVAQGITVPNDTALDEMATLILSVAGYTPQKGVDYWTENDQEDIVQQVITALGTPVFGRVDADNNIILTGELADGTYTFVYEDEAGEVHTIGSYTKAPEVINQIPLSINTDGTQYVGTNGEDGYKTGTRLNSSGAEVTTDKDEIWTTGFMPIKKGDTVYVAGLNWIVGGASSTYSLCYISTYREDFSHIVGGTAFETMVSNVTKTYEVDPETNQLISLTLDGSASANIDDVAWFRMSFSRISNAVPIITVNQPIV